MYQPDEWYWQDLKRLKKKRDRAVLSLVFYGLANLKFGVVPSLGVTWSAVLVLEMFKPPEWLMTTAFVFACLFSSFMSIVLWPWASWSQACKRVDEAVQEEIKLRKKEWEKSRNFTKPLD